MEDLKLEWILPYLPYNLKMDFIIRDKVVYTGILKTVSHNSDETHPTKLGLDNQYDEHIWIFRPYLKQMSHLELDNESKIHLKLFVQADLEYVIGSPLNMDYEDVVYLISKHYDVFGLIDKNLANPL
jgi:hypothetical protein